MADEQKFYSRNIEADHIVSGYFEKHEPGVHTKKYNRIIQSSDPRAKSRNKVIIGSDSSENDEQIPPAIVIEKKNERINKISVKCPCGRHAELTCEYE